jgi:predicted Fe-S protein YdhL (DUF1289 family)
VTQLIRKTPCVGICSTTYGDLVCRGCKRYAHEIDQWNGYELEQRSLVWERLLKLREGAFLTHARISDAAQMLRRAEAFHITDLDVLDEVNVAYELVRRAGRETDFSSLGIEPLAPVGDAIALYQQIEQELYARSLAQYEHDFHVSTR